MVKYRPEGLYEALARSAFAQEYRNSPASIEFVIDAMLEIIRNQIDPESTKAYGSQCGMCKFLFPEEG